MSHDIRTPMNAIIGMTELAQINLRDEAKLRDYLGKIQSSSAHLLGLINEVLDVSKIENGAVELEESEFDLRELVQEAVSIVQLPIRQREQELILQLSEDLHTQVVGDKQRLRQVLVNVLDNASKYNHPHGKIRLSLEELKETEFQMGMYRFIIEDNGIGMKREFLEHIFEPFSRADDLRLSKVTGTGLGMTIVQNLVAVMGGTIQVESEYGKGTRFTVTLSLCKREARQPVEPKELSHPEESFREMRVLLVEDNELNRQIATEMLRLLGTTVETAENGREAVEAVCGHQPFYYDVVFMDIQMPVMNGYEACKAIRASRLEGIEELPIIALTADAFAEDARKARLAMMSGHLSKPISMDQLRRALEGCLRRKHQNHPKGFPKE